MADWVVEIHKIVLNVAVLLIFYSTTPPTNVGTPPYRRRGFRFFDRLKLRELFSSRSFCFHLFYFMLADFTLPQEGEMEYQALCHTGQSQCPPDPVQS